VHGEDQNFGLWQAGPDLAGGLDAVDQGHCIVKNGNVRLGFGGLADRVLAIASLRHDFPVALRLKDLAKARTHDVVVIGNEDA
jgi:hypothetical protein